MTTAPISQRLDPQLQVCLSEDEAGALRLVLDFGFAKIVATGLDDVDDLIEGFGLRDEPRVLCHRYAFTLDEVDDPDGSTRVVYRDKRVELRMTRDDYDRAAFALAYFLADPGLRATRDRVWRRQADADQAAAAEPRA